MTIQDKLAALIFKASLNFLGAEGTSLSPRSLGVGTLAKSNNACIILCLVLAATPGGILRVYGPERRAAALIQGKGEDGERVVFITSAEWPDVDVRTREGGGYPQPIGARRMPKSRAVKSRL